MMTSEGMDEAWTAVRAAEPDGLDRHEVEAVIGDVRRVRAGLDGVERRCVRRLRELEAAGESGPAESVLANAGGRSGRDAAAAAGRDDLCDESPEVADALDEGVISGEYVDAIAAAARDLPDDVRAEFTAHSDTLLQRASKLGLDAFRRECRSLAKRLLTQSRRGDVDELGEQRKASTVKRWIDKVTGMCHTHLELDPVRDAKCSRPGRPTSSGSARPPEVVSSTGKSSRSRPSSTPWSAPHPTVPPMSSSPRRMRRSMLPRATARPAANLPAPAHLVPARRFVEAARAAAGVGAPIAPRRSPW